MDTSAERIRLYGRPKITASIERTAPDKDERRSAVLKYRCEDRCGYNENDIDVALTKDGSLVFCDAKFGPDSGFAYLYPSQVKLLRKWLRWSPGRPRAATRTAKSPAGNK